MYRFCFHHAELALRNSLQQYWCCFMKHNYLMASTLLAQLVREDWERLQIVRVQMCTSVHWHFLVSTASHMKLCLMVPGRLLNSSGWQLNTGLQNKKSQHTEKLVIYFNILLIIYNIIFLSLLAFIIILLCTYHVSV